MKKCPSCFGEGKRHYQGEGLCECWECGGSGKHDDYLKIDKEKKKKEDDFWERLKKEDQKIKEK